MKLYFCFLEYGATGEGLTYIMATVYGNSRKEAAENFCKDHLLNQPMTVEQWKETVKYFKQWVQTFDLNKKSEKQKAKEVLKSFLTPDMIAALFRAGKSGGLREFSFHYYVNNS